MKKQGEMPLGHACNDRLQWLHNICIYHERKTSAWHVKYSTRHERKSRLHDGTVTVDTDKYRLVGVPPSGREPPDIGLTRIR